VPVDGNAADVQIVHAEIREPHGSAVLVCPRRMATGNVTVDGEICTSVCNKNREPTALIGRDQVKPAVAVEVH